MITFRRTFMNDNRTQRGFTLVEILVGMVIGLLCMLAIQQFFAVSERQKRTTTGGSDAQTSGAVALFSLEREARLAGFGTSSDELLKCNSVFVYDDTSGSTKAVSYSPITINPPASRVLPGQNGTDVIQIVYSSSEGVSIGTGANQPSLSSANFKVKSRYGFTQGDLAIAIQDFGNAKGAQCTMYEITQVAGQCGAPPGGQSDVLVAGSGAYKNVYKNCTNGQSRWNGPGAFPTPAGEPAIQQITNGTLYNVGPLPTNQAYAIRNNNLTACDVAFSDCTLASNFTTVADNIVGMRAVYGWNSGAGNTFEWTRKAPSTPAEWQTLSAIRVVLIARNAQPDKPKADGTCDATPDKNRPDNNTWMSQSVAGAEIDLSTLGADWSCYRYKMFQTVVPIRNILWRPGR